MRTTSERPGRKKVDVCAGFRPRWAHPTTCPRLLAIYIALARSIDAFTSSLSQSPSVSLIQPVTVETEAENGSAKGGTELGDTGNVGLVGDVYAGGLEDDVSPKPPGIVW